jgi:Fe-S-cluster containining protein
MASFSSLLGEGDIDRWRAQGRADILHIIDEESAVWMGDHLVSSRDGRYIHGCPFLKTVQDHYACAIYDTRPEVCRNYLPGSSEICPLYKK